MARDGRELATARTHPGDSLMRLETSFDSGTIEGCDRAAEQDRGGGSVAMSACAKPSGRLMPQRAPIERHCRPE